MIEQNIAKMNLQGSVQLSCGTSRASQKSTSLKVVIMTPSLT